jgi:glycine oxidase
VPRPEIIVVGAGIIGCACAHALASAGARVQLLDSRRVGQGASQASAGVLAPYIEGHESTPLRMLGRRSLDLFDAFMATVTSDSGRAVAYDRSGTLEVAFDDDERQRFEAAARTLHRDGVEARFVDAAAAREIEPSLSADALGGLLIDLHGFVSVPELTEALATAAVRAGAQLQLGTQVRAIQHESGRPLVVTDRAALVADRVVLAAGSWAAQIAIGDLVPSPIRPVRGQLLHLESTMTEPLRRVLWSSDCYLVPWPNGRVLVGATVEDAGFDERATAAGVRDLLEAACTLVPQLWQSTFAEVRVGLRPASPDTLPLIGPSDVVPGLIYATGHYRNGVLLAPLTAALVKNLAIGDANDPALALLAPQRLGTV